MKKRIQIILFILFCVSYATGAIYTKAANEKALPDGSRIPANWSVLGCDYPGCTETRNVGVLAHRLQVDAAGVASATINFASGTAFAVANATGTSLLVRAATGTTYAVYNATGTVIATDPAPGTTYAVYNATGTVFNVTPAAGATLDVHPLFSGPVSESRIYSIPATSNSGANLNPSATATAFWCSSESTQILRCFPNGTASSTAGFYTGPYGTFSDHGVPITSMSYYNTGAVANAVSCVFMLAP